MTEAQTGTGMTPSPPTTAPQPRVVVALGADRDRVDTRLLGMVVAIAAIWIAFNILTGGDFLTARNLWNLSVQSTSIAIMATGMVLIIVRATSTSRWGRCSGSSVTRWRWCRPTASSFFGIDFTIDGLPGESYAWVVALAVGVLLGAMVGAVTGSIVAYGGVPSFIVTLGGFLIWRGMIFRTGGKQGQTLSPLQDTFQRLGGGATGSLGEWRSWALALLGCAGVVVVIYLSRRRRQRYDLAVRPMWIEIGLGVLGCATVLAAVGLVANRYDSPITGEPTGVAYPVVILILVTLVMTYLARRRRFGRYVYAYGGNPEAAELSGINTRRTIMLTFVLMGVLVAVSAAIQTGGSTPG